MVRVLLLRRSSSRWPGFQLVLPVDRLAVVFVVDLSDSVGTAGPRGGARVPARDPRGEARTRTSRGSSPSAATRSSSGCRPSSRRSTGSRRRRSGSATDIGAALRLAGALFPDDAQKRIVLLSDGNDTTGSGQTEAALAAARGIQVETRLIGLAGGDEVLVERLTAPSTARLGESVQVTADITSTVAQPATVRACS